MTPSAIHSIQHDVQRLGIKLSEARRRRRMSQRAMADQTGMSLSTVRRLERGEPGVAIHALLSGFKVLEMLDACIGLLDQGQGQGEDAGEQGRAAERLPKRVRQPKVGRDMSVPMRRGSLEAGSPAPAAEFGAGVAHLIEAISLQPQLPVGEPKKSSQGRLAVRKPRQSNSQGQIDLTLPPKNVSLAECFNASKENGNDEDSAGALYAGVQARGGAIGAWWPEHGGGGQNAGRGGADVVQLGQG